jgi:hypothetical protein
VKVADVLPVPPPVIPSWVPEIIVQSVRGQYELAVEAAYGAAARECGYFDEFDDDRVPPEFADALSRDDVLRANIADFVRDELADMAVRYQPLVCDPRMQSVWRQLSRRRPTGEFYYPARVSSAPPAEEQQDLAMLELFNVAFRCQQKRHGETTTRGAIEQRRDRYLAKAKELRADGRMMLDHDGGDWTSGMKRSLAVEVAAQALEDYAREAYATNSAMAFDRKRDNRARWVALTIGNMFCKLFGEPMYGLTAKITSVILGREIATSTVRYWWDRAVKTPKIAP